MTRVLRMSGTVFLECQSQHVDARALDLRAVADHVLDGLLGDELAHAVVDASPRQDHLRVIADLVGLVGEVVGVDADAVPADQAGPEGQEVPLGAGGLQHFERVDADAVEQDGELVHQGDVEVALRVLDHLGRLGDLDARRTVYARGDDALVESGDFFERLRSVARHHFQDAGKRVLLVTGIDALGRVADVEVALPAHAGGFLEDRHAHFLGGAGIDRRFVHDDRAALHVPAYGLARADERAQVGLVRGVHRRRHRDDDEIGGRERRRIGRDLELPGGAQVLAATPRRSDRRTGDSFRPWPATDRSRSSCASCRTPPQAANRRIPAPLQRRRS